MKLIAFCTVFQIAANNGTSYFSIERDDLRTFLDRFVRENDAQFDALRGDVIGGVGDGIAGVRRKIPRLRARLEIAALRLTNIPSWPLPKGEAHRTHLDIDVGRGVGGDRLARGRDIEDAQHCDFVAAAHDKMGFARRRVADGVAAVAGGGIATVVPVDHIRPNAGEGRVERTGDLKVAIDDGPPFVGIRRQGRFLRQGRRRESDRRGETETGQKLAHEEGSSPCSAACPFVSCSFIGYMV